MDPCSELRSLRAALTDDPWRAIVIDLLERLERAS